MGTRAHHNARNTCAKRVVNVSRGGQTVVWEWVTHGVSGVVGSIEHDGVEGVLAVPSAVGEHLRKE
jgi:hypothetical protein